VPWKRKQVHVKLERCYIARNSLKSRHSKEFPVQSYGRTNNLSGLDRVLKISFE
jgi:hypothetical protein